MILHVRVPLVVLTGFLGSGKTTLLNRLLARRAERGETGKLGVIVNELGAVGIDAALLGGESARQIELPGGCVCCVLGDQLDSTLLELVDSVPDLAAIVLETTGVAEPLAIAWALRRPPVAERVRLAAVVTLVDASNCVRSRPISVSVDSQVANADVLLVTKSEISGNRDADAAVAVARELAPKALIRRGTTEQHAGWLEQVLADPSLEATDKSVAEGVHIHDDSCRHPDSSSGHSGHGIDSVWAEVAQVVDLEELEDQLAELPENYVRIKGILRGVDARVPSATPRWFAVHRVGLRVSSEPVGPPEFERGRIVALGPGVEHEALVRVVGFATP
jgi:G3E family GTPase